VTEVFIEKTGGNSIKAHEFDNTTKLNYKATFTIIVGCPNFIKAIGCPRKY
jgi:hypothetical protein